MRPPKDTDERKEYMSRFSVPAAGEYPVMFLQPVTSALYTKDLGGHAAIGKGSEAPGTQLELSEREHVPWKE